MNNEFWEGNVEALRSGCNRGGRIPGFQFSLSSDNNGKDGVHTLSEFLCILLQDMVEQPVHHNSGRQIFSRL